MDYTEIRDGQENILPDAAALFYALRSMGYDNVSAIADLVDNSIDAKADNVWISIDDDLNRIFIADDGIGMSMDTLHNAIRLGGKKAHDKESDLGKYGLGLITASISMGRSIRIITKNNNSYSTAVFDYDLIQKTNKFVADFHESSTNEINSFDFRTNNAASGTVLIIDKCDKLQYTNASDFIKSLNGNSKANEKSRHNIVSLGRTFHAFLKSQKKIFVNGSPVFADDPLMRSTADTREEVNTYISLKTGDGSESQMHVVAVLLKDQGPKINKKLRLSIQGQGFYVLRNGRMIAEALELSNIYNKHNDYNLLRIELDFDSNLDDMMGVNVKKHDVTPNSKIINALAELLSDTIKKARKEAKEKQQKKQNPSTNPFLPDAGHKPSTPTTSATNYPVATNTPPTVTIPTDEDIVYTYSFSSYAGKEDDPLFKISLNNNEVTIRYNLLNSYYVKRVINAEDGVSHKEDLDMFIESALDAHIDASGSASLLTIYANALAKNLCKEQ